MKIIDSENLPEEKKVKPNDKSFTSLRMLTREDNMGFSMSRTFIQPGKENRWHYKHHVEACYCVSGSGVITNERTTEKHEITPGKMYVLDENDPHVFEAHELVELLCVFNPPLKGNELHDDEDSYEPDKNLSPVYNVKPVPIEKVRANDYNPNKVAPPEMELLKTSIQEDGYTQPVVTYYDHVEDLYIVVDGFHRYLTMINDPEIKQKENNCLPVVVINKDISDRMASTIRHNRARGTHNVELMSTIVAELVEMGKGDAWICRHIGMSKDELLRLKQITGVAALFANEEFSQSWGGEHEESEIQKSVSPLDHLGGDSIQHVGGGEQSGEISKQSH